MSAHYRDHPLRPGEQAPNIVLDAISREGRIALHDFRGRSPLLIGLFRGLLCPFCRRHVAAMARLNPALREKGVVSLAVVNTPAERARLYFRYQPIPGLLAASDPERASHRAFGLPLLELTENETDWPHKVGMDAITAMRVDWPGSCLSRWIRPPGATFSARRTGTKSRKQISGHGYPVICSFSASSCSIETEWCAGASRKWKRKAGICAGR